jgi:Skp family chaperone for outer membrane proteins
MPEAEKTESTKESSDKGGQQQTWIGGLTDEQKKELKDLYGSMFKEDLARFQKEITSRDRKLARLQQTLEMDEEERKTLTDAESLRDEALSFYTSRGVPEELLEIGKTLAEIKKIAMAYEKNAPKAEANVSARVDEALSRLAQPLGKGTLLDERIMKPPTGATISDVKDTVFMEQYAEGLNLDHKRAQEITRKLGIRL